MPNAPHVPSGKTKPTREQREAMLETDKLVRATPGMEEIFIDPARVDEAQLFMLFASFSGDIFRTAAAAGIQPEDVTRKAEAGNWLSRIRGLIELKQLDKSGEIERQMSRAINFVQVTKWRMAIDRAIRRLEKMNDTEFFDELCTRTYYESGAIKSKAFSAKILADISTAMEKVHWMSYQSVMDAPQDRAGRREKVKDDGPGDEDIHAKIAKALAGDPETNPVEVALKAQDHQSDHLAPGKSSPPLALPLLVTGSGG